MLMMMSVEQSVEWLAGETEVLDENLPHGRFVNRKSYKTCHYVPLVETQWCSMGVRRFGEIDGL
jgi:hypothetical protein